MCDLIRVQFIESIALQPKKHKQTVMQSATWDFYWPLGQLITSSTFKYSGY